MIKCKAPTLPAMDLVTGGSGIVGAHLLIELLQEGKPVRASRRNDSALSSVRDVFRHYGVEELAKEIEWVEADVLDVIGLADAMQGVERVFHCAALVSFNPRRSRELHAANVIGTANVVNAALATGVRRLLHVSSTAAVGESLDGGLRDETMPWKDVGAVSDYSRSKHLAELEVHRGIAEGLDAVLVNPSVVLGPGPPGRSSMTLVERLRRGTSWFTRGANAFVDARDVATCMRLLMEKGGRGERYLLVGENAGYRELFSMMCGGFGHPQPTREAMPWMLHLARRAEAIRSRLTGSEPMVTAATVSSSISERSYSNAKVSALLGYGFRTLEESVANVVSFAGSRG